MSLYRAEYDGVGNPELEFNAVDEEQAVEIAWKCEVGRGNVENLYQLDDEGKVIKRVY